VLDCRGRRAGPLDAVDLPARLEDDDRTAEPAREPDLGERAPAAADGDHGVTGGHDGQVARVPDACHDDVVDPLVRRPPGFARQDPDRRPAGTLGAARGGRHDLPEPAADDGTPRPRKQAADLLGARLMVSAAADDGHLQGHYGPRLSRSTASPMRGRMIEARGGRHADSARRNSRPRRRLRR
jgi:hypothetical protein